MQLSRGRLPRSLRTVVGVAAVVAVAMPLRAQAPADSLRQRYTLPLLPTIEPAVAAARGAPGTNLGSPSAFGANMGDVFAGVGYQSRARFTQRDDGTAVVGFGLGDARQYLGLEVAVTSVSTIRRGPFDDGTVSFKVHRLLPYGLGIAGGVENALGWGHSDGGRSVFGVASKIVRLADPDVNPYLTLTASVGAGNGRFRSVQDILAGNETVSPFGSLALRVGEPLSFIGDWTGQDLMLGLSITPFERIPIVITPAIADVTHHSGDGARFVIGAGLGFNVRDIGSFLPGLR